MNVRLLPGDEAVLLPSVAPARPLAAPPQDAAVPATAWGTYAGALAATSVACGALHVQAANAHWSVWVPASVFFMVSAIAQFVWAWALVVKPELRRAVLAIGIVGNLGIVCVWSLSRTIALPWSPMGIEPVGWGDAICSGLEAALAVACAAVLLAGTRLKLAPRTAAAFNWVFAVALTTATTLAVPTIS